MQSVIEVYVHVCLIKYLKQEKKGFVRFMVYEIHFIHYFLIENTVLKESAIMKKMHFVYFNLCNLFKKQIYMMIFLKTCVTNKCLKPLKCLNVENSFKYLKLVDVQQFS